MRLLVFGGTQFVGRHIVEAALRQGHDVTLFHRGRTGPDLFPECRHVLGDRLVSLEALPDEEWDAFIDVSAYVPRAVRLASEALAKRVGACVQISTVSVYARGLDKIDEDAPRQRLPDPTVEEVNAETYGGLKALCEDEALNGFERVALVRPTYVVGPHDHTDRFTYWIDRIGQGLPVAVPKRADGSDSPLQYIDARDLGQFTVRLADDRATGAFNACAPSLGFLEALERARAALGSTSSVEAKPDLPEDAPTPMFPPTDGLADVFMRVPNERASAAGLQFRLLEETVRDLWAWRQSNPRPLKF